jgi:hypothetical protein
MKIQFTLVAETPAPSPVILNADDLQAVAQTLGEHAVDFTLKCQAWYTLELDCKVNEFIPYSAEISTLTHDASVRDVLILAPSASLLLPLPTALLLLKGLQRIRETRRWIGTFKF